MENADVIVEHLDGSSRFEQWDPRPHINIRKKTHGDGFVELEIEPAGDMGDEHQLTHTIKLRDAFVSHFSSLEWVCQVALSS